MFMLSQLEKFQFWQIVTMVNFSINYVNAACQNNLKIDIFLKYNYESYIGPSKWQKINLIKSDMENDF